MNIEINYYENKKQRQKALDAASKCTPKKAIFIERGVRGIDLKEQHGN